MAYAYAYLPSIPAAGVFAALFLLEFVIVTILTIHFNKAIHKRFFQGSAVPLSTSYAELPDDFEEPKGRSSSGDSADSSKIAKGHKRQLLKHSFKPGLMAFACLLEGISYILRASYAHKVKNDNPDSITSLYVAYSVLALLGPIYQFTVFLFSFQRVTVLFNFSVISFWSPSQLFRVLVLMNIISSIIQIVGSSRLTEDYGSSMKLLIAGIAVQIACFGLLALCELRFALSMRSAHSNGARIFDAKWRLYMFLLCLCTSMILARSVVRVVEFKEGFKGYIMTHEAFLYVFDAIPVFLVGAIYCTGLPIKIPFQLESESFSMKAQNEGQN